MVLLKFSSNGSKNTLQLIKKNAIFLEGALDVAIVVEMLRCLASFRMKVVEMDSLKFLQ